MITLTPRGPFSLAASVRFLEGFPPAAVRPTGHDVLDLALPLEGSWAVVGIRARQAEDGSVEAEVVPAAGRLDEGEPAQARDQLARILSLDVDGEGFVALADGDPVVRRLQALYPGLRPVTFWSPYEAACWAVISHRIRMTQAAAVKARIAEQFGTAVRVADRTLTAFPAPQALLAAGEALDGVRGLAGPKAAWLRGIAQAALDGRLDAAHLRALPRDEALRELRTLPGVGPFSSELVLLRGAGDPDGFPSQERRLHRAMASLYDLGDDPDPETLQRVAEGWRPYRTWVSLLLRVWLEDRSHELAS